MSLEMIRYDSARWCYVQGFFTQYTGALPAALAGSSVLQVQEYQQVHKYAHDWNPRGGNQNVEGEALTFG